MNVNKSADFLKMMQDSSLLFGTNAPFVEELYEQYLSNPHSVSDEWRSYFDGLPSLPQGSKDQPHRPIQRSFEALPKQVSTGVVASDADHGRKQVFVLQLINAHRFLGLRVANLDPLARHQKPVVAQLDPAHYGLTDADMDTTFETGSLVSAARMTLREILKLLRQTYCGSIGAEYMYLSDVPQKRWIQSRLEGVRGAAVLTGAQRRRILGRLTAAETLERYLHTKYVGQKRFSLEGSETLIPLLDHLLQRAGSQGVQEAVIGMAHRGRLNVLVNILGKQPKMLFAEFEGIHADHLTSGDVKYHQGFSANVATPGGNLHVALAFNPSHLEIVNPVVEGSVRARQHRIKDVTGDKVVPILLHGDAAFAGQGVVMETLNMSQTRGYRTGGTLHIIINNQIGFTASDKRDTRSSQYCSDVARMIDAPIFHVNADDPDAVMLVTEIALDFRMKYKRDVVIDLICFRKLGHNEQDEPLVTQPFMYRYIRKHPGTRAVYAERLTEDRVIQADEAEAMILEYRKAMDEGRNSIQPTLESDADKPASYWKKFKRAVKWNEPVNTAITPERLQQLAIPLTTVPENFVLHSRVQKIVEDRGAMARGELPLDWGMAENLAYAALLTEGYPVRLSGQDARRGTFFHRHASWHDQNRVVWNEGVHTPLRHLAPGQADFVVIDSLLSEEAVLGFEYGYATAEPNTLVLWEAQFGDFANGAQVVIDQFIASGEAKWGRLCGLVMLLPHGYEGQGAEHSSGRIERYLQLCADYNIQVCIPSTSAQMFHLLRRQMLRPYRKPLIVFTPKSLLRSKDASSPLGDFTGGGFSAVIPEVDALENAKVRRIIACSGKIYYELLNARRSKELEDVAVIRLEQLYPFPHDDFAAQVSAYPNATEFVWCQEEPGNQGAWHRIQHYLLRHLRAGMKLGYALRPSSAAPAAGYLAVHNEQQKAVIEAAFRPDLDVKNNPGASRHEHH
ncbi:MAG: 2-oxoglutarate dehydrogenase E1 component [Gallionella sp.]|nr:2-oxoglutarate dehydrogenase E1 component [Gallionella sp.]MDD4947682.1 2-oxoglutarate dehydrogenase E1 component [Gallionella sp.]MDD5612335.1 2-oxoglutarate dehydrogenase E1 component [Gallionella sp.]